MKVDDLVIEAFARDDVLLRERIISLEADVRSYRELSQQALTVVHDLSLERDRLRQRNRQLLEENQALRAELRTLKAAA